MVALQKQTKSEPLPLNKDAVSEQWSAQLEQLQQQRIVSRERLQWMLQLRDALENNDFSVDDFQLMLDLAVRLCDWAIVIHLSHILLQSNTDLKQANQQSIQQENVAQDCAEAYVQMGVPAKAINRLRSALFQHYQNSDVFTCYRWAQRQLTKVQNSRFPWQDCRADELLLTPLEAHHIDAFRWVYSQYRSSEEDDCREDQSIAQLCNLPRFKNDQHWQNWLKRSQSDPNHYLFAVNHQEWGLIGSVSLEVFNGVGFFYYWLGEDFQGYGFGPKAVDILLTLGADYLDMHCCYAKVYDYNQPSQKALQKIGFKPLAFKVAEPYDNERLYYLGPDKTQQQWRDELIQLFDDMESDLELEKHLELLTGN